MREEGQGSELQQMKANFLQAQDLNNISKEHRNDNDTGCHYEHDRSSPVR